MPIKSSQIVHRTGGGPHRFEWFPFSVHNRARGDQHSVADIRASKDIAGDGSVVVKDASGQRGSSCRGDLVGGGWRQWLRWAMQIRAPDVVRCFIVAAAAIEQIEEGKCRSWCSLLLLLLLLLLLSLSLLCRWRKGDRALPGSGRYQFVLEVLQRVEGILGRISAQKVTGSREGGHHRKIINGSFYDGRCLNVIAVVRIRRIINQPDDPAIVADFPAFHGRDAVRCFRCIAIPCCWCR